MNTILDRQQQVQGLMMFVVALSDSLEATTGRGSEAVCFQAGKKVGLGWKVERTTSDISLALELVRQEMEKMGINWPFEVKYPLQSLPEHREIKLPFQNCTVRCSLFRYGFPQGKALCQTKHGLFCGLFEKIYGVEKTYLDIFERGKKNAGAGENACLLTLKIYS